MFIDTRQTVWIAGALGRMGKALSLRLKSGPYDVYTTDSEVDVTDLDTVNEYANSVRPHFIINTVGYKQKDPDEPIDELEAYRVNTLGARNLAIAAEGVGAAMVHLSTDDVFIGNKGTSFNEFDTPHPSNIFGKSKYAGELFVRNLTTRHLIIRSQWVYTALPNDYLHRVAEAIRAGKQVEIPINQIGSPTSARSLTDFIISAMNSGEFGTFHATCQGMVSRYEFFKYALEHIGLSARNLIGSHDQHESYTLKLDNLMMRLVNIYEMPTWQSELDDYLSIHRNDL